MQIAEEEREQWMRIDQQLLCLLWQSVHPTLMVNFRRCRTCRDVFMEVLMRHWEASVTSERLAQQVDLLRRRREKARVREARLLSCAFHDLKIDTENTEKNNQECDMS